MARPAPEITAAANALRTAPGRIADFFGISPERIERMLEARGQAPKEGESIEEAVVKHYGIAASLALQIAFDVFPAFSA